MRQVEIDMLKAIRDGKSMYKQNTTVSYNVGRSARVELHGNRIADVFSDGTISVDLTVLRRWPTPTTKSRLRALGVQVYTKNHCTFIDIGIGDDIDIDIDEFPQTYIIVGGISSEYKDYLRRVYGI